MNEKEIAEIRRRYRQDKSNITHIRGCYVNEQREIVSEFNQALGLMSMEESDTFLGILKKTMSGTLGKNLLDISFDTRQVVDSPEHKLLMALRDSALKDEGAVQDLFQKVIASVGLEGSYLILLAHDTYDVPFRAKDGVRMDEAGGEVYSYFLCSICPVKQLKPALGYYVHENQFHSRTADWIVSPPELGFTFPAFDGRRANIYAALYYTRDTEVSQEAFIDALFCSEPPMPAAVQKETFETILGEALETECSMEVVQAVHDELCERIAEHKENKEEEPLVVSKKAIRTVLSSCGVADARVTAFDARYDEEFGPDREVPPQNLVDPKQLMVQTPGVTIRVDPECGHLVETRVIDGKKYILIRAEEGVEVNGVNVQIT